MSSIERIAVIDCQIAGVSGDMLLGALLDLGADGAKVMEAIRSLESYMKGCGKLEVNIVDVTRRGFHAKKIDVKFEGPAAIKGAQLIETVRNCVENLTLSKRAKQFAFNAVNTLVSAEARVHGESVKEIFLHETGLVDTPAEIIGTVVALEDLNFFNMKVYSLPVAVGGGLFRFSHGTVSSPAPATIEILRSKEFPIMGGPVSSELATPTGVSLLVNIVQEVVRFYPPMTPTAIGYGAGTKDFAEMPNVLRITVGQLLDYQFLRDEIIVLETNLDDVTGEVIGHAVDKLLQEGARDVCVIPMFTKKNRPGHIIKAIADRTTMEHLIKVLIDETGTLGVRVYPCERRILNREIVPVKVEIEDAKESINVKVARNLKGEVLQVKPEYEEVKRIAKKTCKPIRQIMDEVKMKARKALLGE
jgi:hypothetical protein